MKKICNYRPIVLFCVALILGISLSLHAKTSIAAQIVLITTFAATFISWLIMFCVKKYRQLAITHLSKFLVVLIALAVGSLSMFIQFTNVKNSQIEKSTYVTYARVSSMMKENSYGQTIFVVDEISVISEDGKKQLDGNAKVTMYSNNSGISLSIGDYVEIKGTVTSVSEDLSCSVDINNVGNNVYYKMYVSESNVVSLGKNQTTVIEKIHLRTWELLSNNMEAGNAAVSYSMFFGDTAFIDFDTLQDFRDSGIAHLLAVSGLHLGFLVMLLSFIAKKCKFNKYLEFSFITIIMFLYALICGFSSSVFRAFIMTLILLYSKLRFKEYDSLNSIALSAIIILLINPLKLWNAGFQLSYFAVLGIVFLAKPLEDLFSKIFTKKMASSLAVMFAVQLTITFPTMKFFNNFSVLSLLTNIIAIPLANIVFIVLFFSIFLLLILPFSAFILKVAQYAVYPLIWLSNVVASVPFAVIKTKFNNIMLVAGFSAIIINSDYIFIKKRYKIMMAMLSCLVVVCLFVF